MATRASSTGKINFGSLEIPVKMFTAASAERVSFSCVTPAGNPLGQKFIDSETGEDCSRSVCDRGFKTETGELVIFSKEEVESFDSENKGDVTIEEFVPLRSIDMINVDKSYYLKPNKNGNRAFRLLANSMVKTKKVAVAVWNNGGKELLTLIRPYKEGLILHQLFFSDEVRDYEDNSPHVELTEESIRLSDNLVESLSSNKFDAKKYSDKYSERVHKAVKNKISGVNSPKKEEDLDMLSALTKSLQSR
jgi:DNA end-binding protein Ku